MKHPHDPIRYATPLQRAVILLRDGLSCQYCGKSLVGKQWNAEHVLPWIRGGRTEVYNLVVACRGCNKAKGNRRGILPGHGAVKQQIVDLGIRRRKERLAARRAKRRAAKEKRQSHPIP